MKTLSGPMLLAAAQRLKLASYDAAMQAAFTASEAMAQDIAGELGVRFEGIVRSAEGVTARFSALRPGDSCPAILSDYDHIGGWEMSTNPRVLFVDSDENSRLLAREAFPLANVSVTVSQSAEDALHKYDAAEFHGLVTDLHLPGNDGFWLMEKIARKRRDRDQAVLPMVTISGTRFSAIDRQRLAGAKAIMNHPKPVNWRSLANWMQVSCAANAQGRVVERA